MFRLLDNGSAAEMPARGFDAPQIAVIPGMVKPIGTTFSDPEYRKKVRSPGDRYKATLPRPIA